jgi:hypothetical protein
VPDAIKLIERGPGAWMAGIFSFLPEYRGHRMMRSWVSTG